MNSNLFGSLSKKEKTVLVLGGAGYIGSHILGLLKNSGYFPVVLDNLSSGTRESLSEVVFYEGEVADEELIQKIYSQYPFSSVIHFAGFIQVGESVKEPLKYYENNVGSTLKLLSVMRKLKVNHFVFSSSAAVYGEPTANIPMTEQHPQLPLNPYGRSKWMIEQILQDVGNAYDMSIACLRYFNVAGADPSIYAGKRVAPPTNLIPIVLQAVMKEQPVVVFGRDYKTKDGTCIRDYIHVMDLCEAHLLVLNSLLNHTNKKQYLALNLGTSQEHSVLDVIKVAEEVTGKKIHIIFGERRSGDPEYLVADGTLAKTMLGWNPRRSDLQTIIRDAWQYEMNRVYIKNPDRRPELSRRFAN